jgi:FtsP/CotA-like multicopper oxidase with cupredoxin domain
MRGSHRDAADLTRGLADRLVDAVEADSAVSRRAVLGGLGVAGAGAVGLAGRGSAADGLSAGADSVNHDELDPHGAFGPVGAYESAAFDPHEFLRTFNTGAEGDGDLTQRVYEEDGERVREFEFTASLRTIEIAPGVEFPAWTYEGQVPGPTLRVTEGDLIRIVFRNGQDHPHTIHPHVRNLDPAMDGIPQTGDGVIELGEETVYEWRAQPAGCHFYHCHSLPLKEHIHRGLYGVLIVDPDPEAVAARPREYVNYQGPITEEMRADLVERAELRNHEYRADEYDEQVMVMNGFDTNFDGENEVYAANTRAFAYGVAETDAAAGTWEPGETIRPIQVERDRPVRIYLLNTIEFDPINSIHTHSQFFDYYDHGTTLYPTHKTVDTVMQCQAQRGIVELDYSDHEPGLYMVHAHQSEFAELGWMSFFEVDA